MLPPALVPPLLVLPPALLPPLLVLPPALLPPALLPPLLVLPPALLPPLASVLAVPFLSSSPPQFASKPRLLTRIIPR
jgi:hypothetical protein